MGVHVLIPSIFRRQRCAARNYQFDSFFFGQCLRDGIADSSQSAGDEIDAVLFNYAGFLLGGFQAERFIIFYPSMFSPQRHKGFFIIGP